MALHFTRDDFSARQRRARQEMAKAGLFGLLMFQQESMYYLTGYDTSGYSMFQSLYLGADGTLALLTRSADQRQARFTSVIDDIRIWTDREGANPAAELRDMVADYGGGGQRIGVEYHAYGLTTPGVSVGAIYGEMLNTIMRGDGDPSASRWPMGRGQEALFVRFAGRGGDHHRRWLRADQPCSAPSADRPHLMLGTHGGHTRPSVRWPCCSASKCDPSGTARLQSAGGHAP